MNGHTKDRGSLPLRRFLEIDTSSRALMTATRDSLTVMSTGVGWHQNVDSEREGIGWRGWITRQGARPDVLGGCDMYLMNDKTCKQDAK